MITALRAHPPSRGYVVSSFLPEVLTTLHRLDPAIPLGFLYDRAPQIPPPAVPLAWMIPHLKSVNQEAIAAAHASGHKVMVWTVNHSDDIRRLASQGVDAVISDDTELLVRLFR